MRVRLLALILLASAAPAAAQQNASVERRIGQLEQQLRAVQAKVFPAGPETAPDIAPQLAAPDPGGIPATSAVADLNARVDALEAQLARLTGQAEENANRLRLIEESVTQLKNAANPPEMAPPPPAITPAAATSAPADPAAAESAPAGDPAEAAYNAGYRLWEAKDYAGAEAALEGMAKKWPKHRLASWARNLAGRAYLDEGKPATAAKVLLANYQADPKGERAADSLYFLGQSLMRLKKPAEACQVYAELADVYGTTMRDYIRDRLPKARTDAKCS